MTRMQYLTAAYCEMVRLRDKKHAEIIRVTGDRAWMKRNHIPNEAMPHVAQWLGYCRMLGSISADIERERQKPSSAEMVLQ